MCSFLFQRDHIHPSDKLSSDANRLWLTMNYNHPTAETIPLSIKLDILSRCIKGSRVMHPYYLRVSGYSSKWSNYLSRIDYIKKNGIEAAFREFLTYKDPVTRKEVNYFLNKFYKGIPKGQLESEIKKILQEWVNRGYPLPKLPSYASHLLPSSRQTTLVAYI